MTLSRVDLDGIAAALEADVTPAARAETRARYNVAPSQPHPIVVSGRTPPRASIVMATWGLATRQRPYLPNVRAETAAQRFGGAFDARRAIVPADGFFEWNGTGAARRPTWLVPTAPGPLLMAALWDPDVAGGRRFAIVTVAANPDVAPIHDRMPALLSPEAARRWLASADPRLLVPAPAGTLAGRRVSTRVNKVEHDDPACLEPDDGRGQLGLF